MRKDDVDEYINRVPFEPFRIYLSTGVFFDVRSAQMVVLERSTITIGLAIEGPKQRFVKIALVHIAWIEVLLPVP